MCLRNPSFNTIVFGESRDYQQRSDLLKSRLHDHLGFYAIYDWPTHADRLPPSERREHILNFLKEPVRLIWAELWERDSLRRYPWWVEKSQKTAEESWLSEEITAESTVRYGPGTCLYHASLLGFLDVVEICPDDPNECGGPCVIPYLLHSKGVI
jgi:hypothetical protein